MRGVVQKFDFRSSGYARVNQIWTCGREAEGHPCVIGPDAKGRCRAEDSRKRHKREIADGLREIERGAAKIRGAMRGGLAAD